MGSRAAFVENAWGGSLQLSGEFFYQLAFALGCGVLIGLERSFETLGEGLSSHDADSPASELMGLRTFAILSASGFLTALAGEHFPLFVPVAAGAAALILVAAYNRSRDSGVTTEISAMASFGLGMLCRTHPPEAGILALLITILLSSKRLTHSTITKMRRVELTDTLKFLVIIFIVLPLLPNHAVDPYGAFNPYKVGLMVVLICGISFSGYFLTRILGTQRGLGLTGILGGMTSSTAVTAAMSTEARRNPNNALICAFSTVAANATMFIRVAVVVAFVDFSLLTRLVLPLGAMALVAILAAVILWMIAARRQSGVDVVDRRQLELSNPFSIGPALKFAVFFVFVLFAAKFAQTMFGNSGLYAAAAVSGLADVDAITLSIAEQAGNGALERITGAMGIIIAVVSNGIVKTGIAFYSGDLRFGRLIGVCLGAATGTGLLLASFS
jgi:uncharacterized membrane protein (DUF4010 family)